MNIEYWRNRRSQWAWKRWIGLLIAAIGAYIVLAGLTKSLYLFAATVPVLGKPLQYLAWLVYHFVFDWPVLRTVLEWAPVFNLRNHVDPANFSIAVVYMASIFGMGYFRANHARVRWLDGLEHEALEADLRDGFRRGRSQPVQAPASQPVLDESYAREKFHDRYVAPFAVGAVLLILQYVLTLLGAK